MHHPWTRRGPRRVPAGPPLGGPLPQLALAAVCACYAAGALAGWGSPRLARVMGDFGLAAAAFAAAVSCLWYARRQTEEFRAAWTMFGVSSVMIGLGNATWGWYEVVLGRQVPDISLADIAFLLFAPLAIVGLLLLAKRPLTKAGWARLGLDVWLIGGSLMTLSWSVALAHTAVRTGSVGRVALALAYPLLDIVLISMIVVLHFRRSARHRPAINSAIGALALTVFCDALFTSPPLREQYSSGQLLDAGWFAGSLLLAAAPWTAGRSSPAPEAPGLREPRPPACRPLGGSVSALAPYLAAAVCVLSILVTIIFGRRVDAAVVYMACAVVLALLVRQGITLMENISLTRELAQKENYFRSLVQGSSDVIMIAAPDGKLRYVSPAAVGVYGQHPGRLIGSELSTLIHPEDLGRVLHELRRFLAVPPSREPATRVECRVRHGAGHWLNVESSVNRHEGGLIFNTRDVTERVRLQAQLQHSASHDALTDLPNRALFTERVRLALSPGRGAEPDAAVFFIDLDGFKAVNDSAGHQAGDELLVQAARRLREAVRADDTTARLGGDEFAALITGDGGGEPQPREYRILEIAERVRAALSRPYTVDGQDLRVAASIGVAFAEPGCTPAGLMRNADLAMYRAKQAGKARVELYAPQLQTEAVRRAELADRLRGALHAGEFTLLHQPVVHLGDGRLAALHAQARWRSPHGPLTTPVEYLRGGRWNFGPPGEADAPGGVAGDLTGWLVEQAVAAAAHRHAAGHAVPVTLRVPSARLTDRALAVGALQARLAEHRLPPTALLIELSEADPVLASDELRRRLIDLSRFGVGVALGGFGGPGTAATALHRLPVDTVRLDGALVAGVVESPVLGKIVAGLLRIADDLGIDSLADGVDRPEQAAALRALGCRRAQGLAFSAPLDAVALHRLLERGRVPLPALSTALMPAIPRGRAPGQTGAPGQAGAVAPAGAAHPAGPGAPAAALPSAGAVQPPRSHSETSVPRA
ncbi:PAS domain S-box-containing protein/diguanylate cyclase (GGDEF) domain-containing protein [Streptomyces zhaozhouensis]|uniref:PAS domain S-box-containing protein/diguanylate cyclase (GGDEF) domain-containing protein n=1 Tax=Streptomyces zhaozhouensis TaxID=1300267 RepID=A0A286E3L3_9ACTN|nr:diguanylate cyclase [Streptomyces zhaozhouensis]SOD65471.1 PAS domain S-box-containing protein/diguanylate cyclase (GGDEF) domain-containing protein [Streptomyces zhaozhouensis]